MHCAPKVNQETYRFQLIDLNDEMLALDTPSNSLFSQLYFIRQTAHINPQLQHHLLEVDYNNNILGYLYFQSMPFKGKELNTYIPQNQECFFNKTVEKVVDIALDRISWNLMVLGNVFITGDNGQYWNSKIEPKTKWTIIQKAASYMTTQIQLDAFLISDLTEAEIVDHEQMLKQKYRLFEVEPDLVFKVEQSWHTFDDYLQSLVSKYRVRTKKILKNSAAIQIKNLSLTEIETQSKSLFQLYKNVVNKSQFKLAEINADYFIEFKKAYPEQFSVRAIFINELLEGFISFFEDKENLHINFVGLNYDLNKGHCVYQRILYDCIEQGILLKKENIHFGRTASEIKTAVGAVPVKSYSLLKHSSALPNLVIKALTTYLKPEAFETRNPFGKK